MKELQSIDPECELLIYPVTPNDTWQKKAAAVATETLRRKGYDFSKQGKLNAAKATGKKLPPVIEDQGQDGTK
jgi:hypothetical protein